MDFFPQRPPVSPKIYAYELIGVASHRGYIKVGYTEREVDTRIREQTHTVAVPYRVLETWSAMRSDGSCFTDAQSLPYPSLNEINYIVFDEITEEYHDELYGYIVAEDKLSDFIRGKPKRSYIRDQVDRHTHQHTAIHEQKILTEYIRHQIHHPENRLNTHYTQAELKESIELMRTFIALNMNSPEEL